MRRFAPPRLIKAPRVLIACFAMVALLGGCAGAFVGAGATVGVAAYQERGLEGAARDTKLATQIRFSYLESDGTLATNIGIEVYERRALLTGLVETGYAATGSRGAAGGVVEVEVAALAGAETGKQGVAEDGEEIDAETATFDLGGASHVHGSVNVATRGCLGRARPGLHHRDTDEGQDEGEE